MCDGLVRDQARAAEHLVLGRRFVEQHRGGVVEDRRPDAPCRRIERKAPARNRTSRTDRGCPCTVRASRAPTRAGRTRPRDCAPPSSRRSRDGTSGTCGRGARRVSIWNARRRMRTGRSESAASPRTGCAMRSPDVSRESSAPFATASHSAGTVELQRIARLQVRLVEAGKRECARAGTKRVYRKSGLRLRDSSPARNTISMAFSPAASSSRRNDDVTVDRPEVGRLAGDGHGREVVRRPARSRAPAAASVLRDEADRGPAGDRFGSRRGNIERQLIAEVLDGLRTRGRQRERDAWFRIRHGRRGPAAGKR